MPDVYEFGIAGPVGPIINSCISQATVLAVRQWTVLVGTVSGPDELQGLLDLLDAHGNPALDIRLSSHHDPS